jgi:hypothetical protein
VGKRHEVKQLIRESLGLPPKALPAPTLPVEGHLCDFPIWSYSRKRTTVTFLHVDYEDGTYCTVRAPEGMPSPSFPGYFDVLLFHGYRDLAIHDHVELSMYTILKTLGLDPASGRNRQYLRRDMEKVFSLSIKTNRFIHPATGQRIHVDYFRVLRRMRLAEEGRRTSTFYFDDLFLQSLHSGYLKRLDWDFCLALDRQGKPLARFLYAHIAKRLGGKPLYMRRLLGFLQDVGLGYITHQPPKRRNEMVKGTVYPALDLVKGHAFRHYELDNGENIVFLP